MREVLEPIFGASGAVVAQFVITLVVVLALVGVVVWLVRRYGAGGLGATVRGRLPRLAIVDAMAVDTRRKLVLVRRDNVEHLLLIGGPADLVVESGIVRTRMVSQRPGGTATTATRAQPVPSGVAPPPPEDMPAPARRLEPAGADQPIPFPPRRTERPAPRREPARQPAAALEPNAPVQRRAPRAAPVDIPFEGNELRLTPMAAATGQFADAPPLTHVEETELPPGPGEAALAEPMDDPSGVAAEMPGDQRRPGYRHADAPPMEQPDPGRFVPNPGEDEAEFAQSTGGYEAPPISGETEGPLAGEEGDATRVVDLEKDMARLLSEISGRRSS